MSSVFAKVEDFVAVGTTEMLASYGAVCTVVRGHSPPEAPGRMFVATVGFVDAEGSSGSLLLATTRAVIEHVFPPDEAPLSDAEISDALGELSNMLVGRVKSMLLQRGVRVTIGTPTREIAEHPSFHPPKGDCSWTAFELGGGHLYARLDAAFAEGVVLRDESSLQSPELAEGEMRLF